jgi:hypothetical protein
VTVDVKVPVYGDDEVSLTIERRMSVDVALSAR